MRSISMSAAWAMFLSLFFFPPTAVAGVREGDLLLSVNNFEMAERELRPEAEAGNPEAQELMGYMYFQPLNEKCDVKAALEWYEKAANQGHAGALNSLGIHYALGTIVEQDEKRAFAYFQRAATKGEKNAAAAVGEMYLDGRGTERDIEKGMAYIRQAAVRDAPNAAVRLGRMYLYGIGVEADAAQAAVWYLKAFFLPEAIFELGRMYATGHGVQQDSIKAIAHLERAAKGWNDIGAMQELARLYGEGAVVERNEALAADWLAKAERERIRRDDIKARPKSDPYARCRR